MSDRRWYVAFMSEVRLNSGGFAHWPNARIIHEHPLTWHKAVVQQDVLSVTLIWWKELTSEEIALDTQVIDEGPVPPPKRALRPA